MIDETVLLYWQRIYLIGANVYRDTDVSIKDEWLPCSLNYHYSLCAIKNDKCGLMRTTPKTSSRDTHTLVLPIYSRRQKFYHLTCFTETINYHELKNARCREWVHSYQTMALNPPLPVDLLPYNHKSQDVSFIGRNMHTFNTLHFHVNEYRGSLGGRGDDRAFAADSTFNSLFHTNCFLDHMPSIQAIVYFYKVNIDFGQKRLHILLYSFSQNNISMVDW